MKNLLRYAAGFYLGAASMLAFTIYTFGNSVEHAVLQGLIWPYLIVRFFLFVCCGVELP